MVKLEYKYIVKTKGYRGGMARVKDSGVTVAGIVIMQHGGDSIDAIILAYPNLTEEKVREALDYYTVNKAEIDGDIYILTHKPKGYRIGLNGILEKK